MSEVAPPSRPGPVGNAPSVPGEITGQIKNLPDALQSVPRTQTLEGEVLRQNPDGTIRIRISEGHIDVKIQTRTPLQPGTRLEVEIPAGNPPRQITIRQVPAAPPAEATQTRPNSQPNKQPAAPAPQSHAQVPPSSTTGPLPKISPVPHAQAPVPPPNHEGSRPALVPLLNTPTPNTPVSVPLDPGTAVRLIPLPPPQARHIFQLLAAQPDTALTQTILDRVLQPQAPGRPTPPTKASESPLQTLKAALEPLLAVLKTLPAFAPGAASPIPEKVRSPFLTPAQAAALLPGPPVLPAQTPAAAPAPVPGKIPAFPASQDGATAAPKTPPLDMRVIQVQPPAPFVPQGTGTATLTAPQATMPIPPGSAGTAEARVLGFNPQNFPVLSLAQPGQTSPQIFTLQFSPANLQPGSRISFMPLPAAAPIPQPAPIPSSWPALMTPGLWEGLDDLYQSLLQSAPQAAQALSRILPAPGNPAQLTPAALMFVAAIRAGDVGMLFENKDIEALRRLGRLPQLARSTQETSTLSRLSAEPIAQDWRGMPIPLYWQGEIHKIALYWKHQDGSRGTDKESGDRQTRFIFDLALTRMGDVQLDGLVRGNRLDLMIRSHSPFSMPMQQAMRQAYTRALESSDLHGELNFQGSGTWVHVLEKSKSFGVSA